MRGLRERLARLGSWQARLGPWGRSLWRGALRGSATFAILFGLYAFSLTMGRDHSPLLFLGWAGWIAASVGAVGAFEERWGRRAPWRTAILCTFIGWVACLGAIGQWGYLAGIAEGQVAGWESALAALSKVRFDIWVALAAACQVLGAAVLLRKGKEMAGWLYANVALSLLLVPIGLFMVCAFEDWAWSILEKAAQAEQPEPESPDPEAGASG